MMRNLITQSVLLTAMSLIHCREAFGLRPILRLRNNTIGIEGLPRLLKNACFEKDASPIVFSNAYPVAIPNSVTDKTSIRKKLIPHIPSHIETIFENSLSSRFKLVIQHGSDESDTSLMATDLIKNECVKRNLPYFATSFFLNNHSVEIQRALRNARPDIPEIVDYFLNTPKTSATEH